MVLFFLQGTVVRTLTFISLIINGLAEINPAIIIAVSTGLMVAKVLTLINGVLPVLAATSTMAAGGLGALGIAGGISSSQILVMASAVALLVGLFLLLTKGAGEAKSAINDVESTANNMVNTNLQHAQNAVGSAGRNSYAIGTQYHSGGDAAIHANEEVIIPNLPRGTIVKSAMETAQDNNTGATYQINGPISITTNNAEDLFNQIQILARRGALT